MRFPKGSLTWLEAESFVADGIWYDLSGNDNHMIVYDAVLEDEFIIEDVLDADLING